MFNILIVEDNINNMRLFNQILMDVEKNICITEAFSGKEAIAKSKDMTYDIVLMDIALPDIDGIETRRRLVELANFTDTIFVAVTAHSSKEDQKKLEEDFDYYLSKPLDDEELISLVSKLLK